MGGVKQKRSGKCVGCVRRLQEVAGPKARATKFLSVGWRPGGRWVLQQSEGGGALQGMEGSKGKGSCEGRTVVEGKGKSDSGDGERRGDHSGVGGGGGGRRGSVAGHMKFKSAKEGKVLVNYEQATQPCLGAGRALPIDDGVGEIILVLGDKIGWLMLTGSNEKKGRRR
ncbi:hypothetical protein FB446DRAFT_702995 [Lentinula raphanica]|nr:hypothetical protein FB446DRAFT_702995 [Lentinula raphanica]